MLAQLLMRPTSRPGEPVTAGLPVGPGPGPEAVSGPSVDDQVRLATLLRQATDPSTPPNLRTLALMWKMVLEARRATPVTEVPLTEADMLADTLSDLGGEQFGPFAEEPV